ncbi:DUF2612 domain-containing protein [Marinibaculum pumilum]|uniref:DUF2612 domain-containing protein n=1 Tax=Marinibaculum pumilum TaxID=1766165 RepID=A0ABV7KYD5_9PROT
MPRTAQALGLLITQYRRSPRALALIGAFAAELDGVDATAVDLLTKRALDTAEGAQLDVIGKIVDLSRPFFDPDPDLVFTFDGPAGLGFSSLDRPDLGGYFRGLALTGGDLVTDEIYRGRLRAKIIRNTTNAGINEITRYLLFLFPHDMTVLEGIGFVSVSIHAPLTLTEQALVRTTVPLAAGVRLIYAAFALGPNPFGFAGSQGLNTGFGSVEAPQDGSGFVKTI